ncbi:MAG: hypothetical protein QM783_17715 [Phycisphaerales bacterium]
MKNILCVICAATVASAALANPIVNGDFETGTLGPSTTAYASTNIYDPAQYIITNYDTVHTSWVDFYDHTYGTGDGHYMVVNGTDDGLGPTWAQTVSVTANTQYELSAWFASLYPAAIATIEFRVNGQLVVPQFSAPNALGVWEQRSVVFNTGNSTSISVEIWDYNQSYTGNDYAIDDIALNVVPTPGSAATLAVGALAAMRRRRV